MSFNENTQDFGRHAVVAIIVEQSKYLVIRRSAFVRAPGLLCFPGGGIEASGAARAKPTSAARAIGVVGRMFMMLVLDLRSRSSGATSRNCAVPGARSNPSDVIGTPRIPVTGRGPTDVG